MRKCTSCNKNISEFSEVCPYCGAKYGDKAPTNNGSAVKPVHVSDTYAIGSGVICIILGILSVLSYVLPVMHEIPPTSIFARLKAFDLGDIIYMAMFALLGAFIIRRKKDKLLVIVAAVFGIWQLYNNFSWLEPLLHGEFHIDYTLHFLLPVVFCVVLFIAVLHYCCLDKKSKLIWKLPVIVAIICFVLNTIWLILSRRALSLIELIWLPLLIVGSYLFGKWIKEA